MPSDFHRQHTLPNVLTTHTNTLMASSPLGNPYKNDILTAFEHEIVDLSEN